MEKKNIKDKLFTIISLITYMVITLIITVNHENWRDEAQSFMIAKNLSLIDIFKQLKYEGHPFVFYYLVRIFTLFGFEYRIVNVISWVVMSIVAYIILDKSPFNKPTRILILLTVPFIYQYVAFGRSYCLVTLFTILLAYLYDKKEQHPYIYAVLIALLMNTHMFMLGFSLMLVICFYVYELIFKRRELDLKQKKKYFICLGIILIAIILLVIQFSGTLSSNSYATIETDKMDLGKIATQAIKQLIFYYTYSITYNESITLITTVIIGVTIGLSFSFKQVKEILILIGAIAYQVLFVALLQQDKVYILMTGFVIYIFYLWIILNKVPNISKNKAYKTVITSLFIMTCLTSIVFGSRECVYSDLNYKYSCAKETAMYIKENIEKESVFLCINDTISSSVIPYIEEDYTFYAIISDDYYTYISWDKKRNVGLTNEGYISRIEKYVKENNDKDNIYIIFNYTLGNEIYNHFINNGNLKYEYVSTGAYSEYQENYYLYKFIE